MKFRLLILICLTSAFCARAQVVTDSLSHHWSPTGTVLSSAGVTLGVSSLYLQPLHDLDISLRDWIQVDDRPKMHVDNALQYLPAAGVYALKLGGVPSAHDYWGVTKRMALTYTVVAAVTLSSKYLFVDRVRPDGSASNSFPSGHTATVFAGAEMLRLEYKNVTPWIGVAGYSIATITGCLRVYNDRHWMTDVLAGAGVGFLSAQLSYSLNSWMDDCRRPKELSHSSLPTYCL